MSVDEQAKLVERFENDRTHLRGVAYRMLGSASEADDAVQDAWLRLTRVDASAIDNLSAWLTTVVARVCLDRLRSRKLRREQSLDAQPLAPAEASIEGAAAHEAQLADTIGPALLVVLDTLAPAERIAFVMHDLFAVPFEEVAPIVGRTAAATRQLASRARRRVQGAPVASDADLVHKRAIVDAFLSASREGKFDALLAVLDPDVVFRADAAAQTLGAQRELRGADAVAKNFQGRARNARAALVDGLPGIVIPTPSGEAKLVLALTFEGGKIAGIELLAGAEVLADLDLTLV